MLGCAAAKAVALSLLKLLDSHGGDGRTQHHMRWTGTTDTLGSARELRSGEGETCSRSFSEVEQ